MLAEGTNGKAALVIAHPGHELCVYGWLEAVRPAVLVLTDGSGRSNGSRLPSTSSVLAHAEARPGPLYGKLTDRTVYAAILALDFGVFERFVADLAEVLEQEEVAEVVGDAMEGYNPVHDVCRLAIDAAVDVVGRRTGRRIVNRDFPLFARQDATPPDAAALRLELDEDTFERKLALARAYPELKGEVDAALDQVMLESLRPFPELHAQAAEVIGAMGREAYRVECLCLVNGRAASPAAAGDARPFYERYGELLAAQGVYRTPIRYREHVLPLAQALRRFAQTSS